MNKWDIILYILLFIVMTFLILWFTSFYLFVRYDDCMLEKGDVRICEKELDKLIPHWK